MFSREAVDVLEPGRVERPASGRSQGLVFGYGAGRVAELGEAAMLRVFEDASLQNRQFAANLIAWLAGRLTPAAAPDPGD